MYVCVFVCVCEIVNASLVMSVSVGIQVVGVNRTVDESEGSVEVCFMMDNVAEIPISIQVTFDMGVNTSVMPALGIYNIGTSNL